MRIAATALGLCVAVTASCSSSRPSPEPTSPPEAQAPGQATGQEPLSQSEYSKQQAEQLSLAEQKKQFLVDNHLQRAGELKERMELESAEEELARALQLDPDNLDAKRMLSEGRQFLGAMWKRRRMAGRAGASAA